MDNIFWGYLFEILREIVISTDLSDYFGASGVFKHAESISALKNEF